MGERYTPKPKLIPQSKDGRVAMRPMGSASNFTSEPPDMKRMGIKVIQNVSVSRSTRKPSMPKMPWDKESGE
jgi:hypothetical protein